MHALPPFMNLLFIVIRNNFVKRCCWIDMFVLVQDKLTKIYYNYINETTSKILQLKTFNCI